MLLTAGDYPINFKPWRDSLPETCESLRELRRRNIRYAIFSGTFACWYALRETADTDLLIHPDDFWEAAGVLEATIDRRNFDVPTGHGAPLRYSGVRAIAQRDGRAIEIIQPTTPIRSRGYEYTIGLTDRAVEACTDYDGVVAAHIGDTALIKTLMWRNYGGKDDPGDVRRLAQYIYPSEADYIARRSQEIGISADPVVGGVLRRVLPFVEIPMPGVINNGNVLA